MTITEASRLELHQELRNNIGVKAADTLMEHLPPTGWADIVRRSDLDHQTTVTTREFALVRSEMSSEFVAVRNEMKTEFAAVRNEMKTEFAAVRNEMKTEFAAVRNEMKTEFAAVRGEISLSISEMKAHIDNRLAAQTRWIVTLTSANTLAMAALIVAVVLKL